ncbi:lysophospholipase L2 [Alishewanella longhuensis]|uniref:Lysophospholipase L2 n=1 Tax=Alishewanella longhuensis TaxID=1091037 RepID=A0ABQ3L2P2_9ALTE|nr:alpha/beta fold hydrolase [Alishewanella longhuensis]GHG76173.1 lysophospholipase L2 [Alishewanella longhuensis]
MSEPIFPTIQQLCAESQLTEHWSEVLLPFWRQLQHEQFSGVAGVPIHYTYCHTPGANRVWVISSGRIETAIKYTELIYELSQAGYSVFILDHRGQGRSGRMLHDTQLGYVADFQDYQHDLVTFLRDVVKPAGYQQHILLAHSMGAAIGAALLTQPRWQEWHQFFHAAVLCSPMFGIYTGVIPAWLAEPTALLYCRVIRTLAPQQQRYFPSQLAYRDKPFLENELTGSAARYQALRNCYQTEPQLQLGGVTCQWLQQAILAMRELQRHARHCQTPILMLQSTEDKVVANKAQQRWFAQLAADLPKQLVALPGARHEILMEQDFLRIAAFSAINQFLSRC